MIESVLVVALSARALAQSAQRAGYAVHSIDLFADADTRVAVQSARVAAGGKAAFDVTSLRLVVGDVLTAHPSAAVVYGSGLEQQPELLDELFPASLLSGNPSAVVRAVKDPATLFPALKRLDIAHPETLVSGRIPSAGWLLKQVGGCGGGYVRDALSGAELMEGWYAQRRAVGRSMSMLFLADGIHAALLGCCEHWCAQPELIPAFLRSGMVRVSLTGELSALLEGWADRLTAAFRLRGLCGIDFILGPDNAPRLLEINPRPPASFELFETEASDSLFAAHLHGCRGELCKPAIADSVRAAAVCYAARELSVPEGFRWPDWMADRPGCGTRIARAEPLCTVFATGNTPAQAIGIAQQRIRELHAMIGETTGG